MLLKEYFQKNKHRIDYVYGIKDNIEFLFLKNGINLEIWQKDILPKLKNNEIVKISPGIIKEITKKTDDYYNLLINTGSILIINENKEYSIALNMPIKRMPQDSISDPPNLIGSRDGFTEVISENRNLIKKRIKTNNLVFNELIIGKNTLTEVNLIYINNLVNFKVLNDIIKKLSSKSENDLISINDLINIFSSNELFPNVQISGSPETISNALLKGRIIMMMDNNPNCIIFPSTLFELTENVNEVGGYQYSNLFNRIFIIIFLFISIFSLGLFIVLTSHHPEMLSTVFIANFQLSERGTTFPLIFEIIIVLILFEFYRLLASRSPISFVQNIIIIFGGLFIGQNAIEASLIGSISIIIASLSFVSGFAVTNNQFLITTFSIFRFFILIMSYIFGIIGFLISSIYIIDYLVNKNNYENNYLSPFVPFNFTKIKHWFIPRKE